MKTVTRRRRWGGQRGQELVEFALTSTVFLLVAFGAVELGIGIWQYNTMASLAQDGARYASVRGKTSSSPASSSDVQTYVQGRALGWTVAVTTSPAPSSLDAGATVTVTVQTTFAPITATILPVGTLTLSSSAQMLMAR